MKETFYYTFEAGDEPKKKTLKAKQMFSGQLGRIVHSDPYCDHEGTIVLKTFERLVALNTDGATWTVDGKMDPNFDIELLPPDTKITLTVKE